MRRATLRITGRAGFILLVAASLLTSGLVGGTFALYNGETENAGSTFAGGWIGAPESLTATPEGYDVLLKWTPGTHGPVTGQKLYGEDNGTSSTCTGSTSLIATLALATTKEKKDENRGNATNYGDWFCYALQSTSATVWTAQATQAVQLGLVANGLSTENAASKCANEGPKEAPAPTSGVIDCNDKITITFNQQPKLAATGTIKVCVFASEIVLGEACGPSPGSAYTVGKMMLAGAKATTSSKFEKSTYTLTESVTKPAQWEMKITLVGNVNDSVVQKEGSATPTWTLTPAAAIKSFSKTHEATICSAPKTTCQPTTTTNF